MVYLLLQWGLLLHTFGVGLSTAFPKVVARNYSTDNSHSVSTVSSLSLTRSSLIAQNDISVASGTLYPITSHRETTSEIPDWQITNLTFWTSLVTAPSPTVTSQSQIWTVPVYTGPLDSSSVAQCYTSWQTYFKRLTTTYSTSAYTTTITSTVDPGITGFIRGTNTETRISTTEYFNGPFTESARTTTWFVIKTGSLPQYGVPSLTTITNHGTTSYPIIGDPLSSQPSCALPSVVPECQSKWLSYLDTGGYPNPYYKPMQPSCQFAKLGSSACWSLRDKYVTYWNSWGTQYLSMSSGYSQVSTTEFYGNYVTMYAWPKYTSLAPDCSLGCARCAMTGGTIQMLYWPATTTYETSNGPVTAVVDGSTLTYPTVYVSYREIFASDSCGPVGPSVTNTIVAIPNPSAISSIYGTITEYAPAYTLFPPQLLTTAFDVNDLQPPVPYSIYERQPWCQSLLNAWTYNNDAYGPNPSTTRCPTTDAFRPILYLPSAILNSMNTLWASCSGDVRGAYDPPSALTQATSTPEATLPELRTTVPELSPTVYPAPTPAAAITSVPTSTVTHSTSPVASPAAIPDRNSQPIGSGIVRTPTPTLTPDARSIVIYNEDGTVVVSGLDSPPLYLSQGQETTLDGFSISIGHDGGPVLVNGITTLQLSRDSVTLGQQSLKMCTDTAFTTVDGSKSSTLASNSVNTAAQSVVTTNDRTFQTEVSGIGRVLSNSTVASGTVARPLFTSNTPGSGNLSTIVPSGESGQSRMALGSRTSFWAGLGLVTMMLML